MAITAAMREEVSQLYVALFGRAPDGEGLGYWVQRRDAGLSVAQVANEMYATTPARTYYPSFATNAEIVTNFYVNVLGRQPDAGGLAYWTGQLNSATPGSVIASMINNVMNYGGTDAQGLVSAALFQNKAAVATAYGLANGSVAGATSILSTVTDAAATRTAALTSISSGTATGVGGSAGQTFTLTNSSSTTTAGTDNISTTSGNDTLNAAAYNSLGAADSISDPSKADTDTLSARYLLGGTDTQATANGATISPASVANIEVIKVGLVDGDTTAAHTATVDMTNFSNYKQVINSGSASTTGQQDTLKFTNIAAGTIVGVTNGDAHSKSEFVFASTATAGNADAATLALDAAKSDLVTIAGIETLTVTGAGTSTLDALTAAAATKLIVSGSGKTTITDLGSGSTAVKSIDASAATGNVVIKAILGATVETITGGAGNDTFAFTAASPITVADTVEGGAGNDTLEFNSSVSGSFTKVTGFEILNLATAGSTADAESIAGITSFSSNVTGGTVGFTNLANNASVTLKGDTPTTVTTSAKAASSTLTLTLDNSPTTGTQDGVDVTTLTALNVSTLNLVSSGRANLTASTDSNSIGSVNVKTINVSGDTNIDLTIGTTTTALNASTFTGHLIASGGSTSGIAMTGGSGNDSLNGSSGADTLSGGAGNDTLTGSTGNDSISGGDGNDTIKAASGQITKNDTIAGGADTDTIEFTNAVTLDVSNGGANADDFSNVSGIEAFKFSTAASSLTMDDLFISAQGGNVKVTTADVTGGSVVAGSVLTSSNRVTVDVSGITTAAGRTFAYTGSNGVDAYTGGAGVDTITYATTTFLSATDTISGGTNNDVLQFSSTSGGTLTAARLAGVTGFESILISATTAASSTASASITVDDTVVGNNYNFDDTKIILGHSASTNALHLKVDASAVTSAYATSITGGAGNDTITGGGANDTIVAGEGTDTLDAAAGTGDALDSSAAAIVDGGEEDGLVVNLSGSTINTRLDFVAGGIGESGNGIAGTAQVSGGVGTIANNTVSVWNNGAVASTSFNASISGFEKYTLSGEADYFLGNVTTAVAESITAGAGADWIHGGAGNDTVNGGANADTIYGGTGNDSITGGSGADTVIGGAGVDHFVMSAAGDGLDGDGLTVVNNDGAAGVAGVLDTIALTTSADQITDFSAGTDKLILSAFGTLTEQTANTLASATATTTGDVTNGKYVLVYGTLAGTTLTVTASGAATHTAVFFDADTTAAVDTEVVLITGVITNADIVVA